MTQGHRIQSGRWNTGGLYGIDSLVRDMSRLE